MRPEQELGSTQERGSDAVNEKWAQASATVAVIYGGESMHACRNLKKRSEHPCICAPSRVQNRTGITGTVTRLTAMHRF